MKTGYLLDRLIAIARAAKTDFALSMNMTPSGLSKILTGRRLPVLRERPAFARQAAAYFADALWAPNCCLKLGDLFPLLYDFEGRQELELFLCHAIEWALRADFAEELGEDGIYPAEEMTFVGKREVLNRFCLIAGELVRDRAEGPPALFSALPFFTPQYADIFGRMRILRPERMDGVVLNHYFDPSAFDDPRRALGVDALARIVGIESRLDLRLWNVGGGLDAHFLLAKGECLILLGMPLGGAPTMTVIRHRGYLAMFHHALLRQPAAKVTYGGAEARDFLLANPGYLDALAEEGIDAVYNALSIGYMLEADDLDPARAADPAAGPMLALFKRVLLGDARFCVTVDAMLNIARTGRAIVPLLGAVELAPDQRIPYLQRLHAYVGGRGDDRIRVLNGEMPPSVILCARGLTIIYLLSEDGAREKLHCFATDGILAALGGELGRLGAPTLTFSIDLWDAYIGEIAKELRKPAPPTGRLVSSFNI